MSNFHLGDIYRMSYLRRWQLAGDIRQQSVAEHSWNVVSITTYLLVASGIKLKSAPVGHLLTLAHWHDYSEIVTGDLPSNVKKTLQIDDSMINDAIGGPAALGDKKSCSAMTDLFTTHSGTLVGESFIKVADIFDAIGWISRHGNPESALHIKIKKELYMTLESMYIKYEFCDADRATFDLCLQCLLKDSGIVIRDLGL